MCQFVCMREHVCKCVCLQEPVHARVCVREHIEEERDHMWEAACEYL